MTEITGYCPCCGEPRINGHIDHDYECIWWEDKKLIEDVDYTIIENVNKREECK